MRVPQIGGLNLSSFRKSSLIAFLGTYLAWTPVADATRYLVQMHSPAMAQRIALQVREAKEPQLGMRNAFLNLPRKPADKSVLVSDLGLKVQDVQRAGRLLTVEVNSDVELSQLANNPHFAFYEAEEFFKAPDPVVEYKGPQAWRNVYSEFKEIPWGLKAAKVIEAWNVNPTQPIMGNGARVLVLDTGIDRNHEDLAERFEKGQNFMEKGPFEAQEIGDGHYELLQGQQQMDFWETDFFQNDYDYFDTNGHGTHVAGTIAATYNGSGVVGVAPQSRILAGRVCGNQGCSSLGIVKGIYWGIEERVDVINMSLGGKNASRATAEAVAAAENAGVVVVAASGNDGEERVSFPAAHPEAIAVGAISPFLQRASFSNYGPELDIVAPGVDVLSSVPRKMGRISQVFIYVQGLPDQIQSSIFTGSLDNPNPIQGPLVHVGLGRPEDLMNIDVNGKIALVGRGEIAFGDKVTNVLARGARGVLIYNNNGEGPAAGTLGNETRAPIPVAGITQFAGQKLAESLNQGLRIEASIAAQASSYQAFSGTSMAAPHVAGIAALIKGIRKDLRGADVKAILKSTAQAMENRLPNESGSGLVNAEIAVRTALGFSGAPLPADPGMGQRHEQMEFDFGRP